MEEPEKKSFSKVVLYNGTIKSSNFTQIKKFLDRGADVNSKDSHNKTILWWAAFNGNIELVTCLK